jgi:hypothetical protein
MAGYLNARKIRIYDYPRCAQPFRDRIRENAERIAAEHDIEITFVRKASNGRQHHVLHGDQQLRRFGAAQPEL